MIVARKWFKFAGYNRSDINEHRWKYEVRPKNLYYLLYFWLFWCHFYTIKTHLLILIVYLYHLKIALLFSAFTFCFNCKIKNKIKIPHLAFSFLSSDGILIIKFFGLTHGSRRVRWKWLNVALRIIWRNPYESFCKIVRCHTFFLKTFCKMSHNF